MKHSYLIGLGGSGGKIISELYTRLIAEHGENFKNNVTCIAIDTDQDELDELSKLGVNQICISGKGSVGQYINQLEDDVTDWCPNTQNEGNFYSSSVFNGASQCRLKSRLCLAGFLRDDNNALAQKLSESLIPQADDPLNQSPPIIFIASSIAGGTGSGIFIQIAFYIKKFFRDHGIQNVIVNGLFACPDLYVKDVDSQQHTSLYANAYAVIRELNAFNLICGGETTDAYGGQLDIDVEISTSCEGNLFPKDSNGRYGDKPYDTLYFIDKVNYLSNILGGLPEYYKAMANIAYSVLYTELFGETLTITSNHMHAHNVAPGAIYASAGASSLIYPFKDIVRYFSCRAIAESFDSVWSELDKKWADFCKEKDAQERSKGLAKYNPAPGEREDHYIKDFEELVLKSSVISTTKFSFMRAMVERDNKSAVDTLISVIEETALTEIQTDSRIIDAQTKYRLSDLNKTQQSIINKIQNATSETIGEGAIFKQIRDIDNTLEQYFRECIRFVADSSISFANRIFCEDRDLCENYDKDNCNVIQGLLQKKNGTENEWVHPVAGRYLLYSFIRKLKEKIDDFKKSIDSPADDVDDYFNQLMTQIVIPHKKVLSTNEENSQSNEKILQSKLEKIWRSKAKAATGVEDYFRQLKTKLNKAEGLLTEALLYFSYSIVYERLVKLANEYELFFDNIGEFIKKANKAVTAAENMHDNSRGVMYVCASADVKRAMYDKVGKHIDLQLGTTASRINQSLFEAMRTKAAPSKKIRIKKTNSVHSQAADMEAFFNMVSDIVTESNLQNTDIKGSVDKNIFDALLYEYALLNPEHDDDEVKYADQNNTSARERLNAFFSAKLANIAALSAPLLMYDAEDQYNEMFRSVDENGNIVEKFKVTNTHRFIAHNPELEDSICALLGTPNNNASVHAFYNGFISKLPKDTLNQSIHLTYASNKDSDRYTMLFYSTVECLQPYQIKAFDEIKGGKYFEHYSKRIAEMEITQRYSMTPHLDKRWHKHGVMPYINVSKENERRLDLAKAFLFALCYQKIGYHKDGSDIKLVYQDAKLGRAPELIIYQGRPVPYNKLSKAMYWFADHDNLIETYSAQFDMYIEQEIESLSKYSDSVGEYKRGITNYARILRQFKKNILRPIQVVASKSGRAKKLQEVEPISILTFAWMLHKSEESDIDKNYSELLVEVLCDILQKYAKAPFNGSDIANRNTGSESYINYIDVLEHMKNAFVNEFVEALAKQKKEILPVTEETEIFAEDEKDNYFGISEEDLTEDNFDINNKLMTSGGSNFAQDTSLLWVKAQMDRYINN